MRETEYAPSDRQAIAQTSRVAEKMLRPHALLLQFLSSRFHSYKHKDGQLVAMARRVALRMLSGWQRWWCVFTFFYGKDADYECSERKSTPLGPGASPEFAVIRLQSYAVKQYAPSRLSESASHCVLCCILALPLSCSVSLSGLGSALTTELCGSDGLMAATGPKCRLNTMLQPLCIRPSIKVVGNGQIYLPVQRIQPT